jgi:osmotically-inducible protein OsmY
MRAVRRTPEHPPRQPYRAGLLACALLLVVSGLVAIPSAFPSDRETEQRDADARQTLYVRRALNEDVGLAPHTADLWVQVQGTTAILSGRLPSAMLRQRAIYLTGQVKGIAEVRSDDLQVVIRDGVPDLPSPFIEGVPPRGTLANNSKDGRTTQEPKKTDVPDATPGSVVLLPPIHASGSTPTPHSAPVIEMLPPRPVPEQADLSAAVEALRRKEERFRRLKVEVRRKTVFLSGSVSRWDDVNDLAAAVRRVAGVEAVILDNIHVDRNGAR